MPNRIDTTLSKLREAAQPALAPFITTGFPDIPTSESLARVLLESGGDMLEIGVPFSDPLADGPTVQMTSYRALQNGVTVSRCIQTVKNLRDGGVDSPLILMGYYNPFLRYGLQRFLDDSAAAGVDGMIVPDLPTEEAAQLSEMAATRGIHLIPLLAPTSSDERIRDACQSAGGFIYCVNFIGVTGARSSASQSTPALVERIRRYTDLPILVGFGVSRREHFEEIATYADGAILASALIDAVERAPDDRKLDTARDFMRALKGTNGRSG